MVQKLTFNLTSDAIPLCDLLKVLGVVESGGQAKYLISEGEVTVDQKIERRKRCQIRSGQQVRFLDYEIVVV